jgi:hypothetical protein
MVRFAIRIGAAEQTRDALTEWVDAASHRVPGVYLIDPCTTHRSLIGDWLRSAPRDVAHDQKTAEAFCVLAGIAARRDRWRSGC